MLIYYIIRIKMLKNNCYFSLFFNLDKYSNIKRAYILFTLLLTEFFFRRFLMLHYYRKYIAQLVFKKYLNEKDIFK